MPNKRQTKICLVTPEFPYSQWGGLARTAFQVAGHVRDMGFEVHVAHLSVADDPLVLLDENVRTEILDGMTVHRIQTGKEYFPAGTRTLWDCPHTLTLCMMYHSLEKLHRNIGFDLFHSLFLYPVGYVTGLLARRFHLPHIATIVGNDIKKYIFSPEKAGLCLLALTHADRVVGVSRELIDMADSLTEITHKARVIYNSVAIPDKSWRPHARKDLFIPQGDKFRKSRQAAQLSFKLGMAGIFKYAKGLPYLLKAIEKLRCTGPVELELVGVVRDSEQIILDRMLEGTGTKTIVRIRAAMDHDQIFAWLLDLDAFVLPSVSEGCPNILMEAMACGLPCVATQVGAVPNLIEDGISGLVVPWGEADALARALAEIRADPEYAAAMGRAARERMKLFSLTREAAEWKKVYRELLPISI